MIVPVFMNQKLWGLLGEQLQQRAIQLLVAVRPALNGDLTVRAPITEDEVGTIADAYNNTLQSLRKIVMQVQEASKEVAQTSQNSESSIVGLATAIEATRSGEYGRGFAVVADEVRSLARQSAATTEIDKLVQEIQEGTAEIATAMETLRFYPPLGCLQGVAEHGSRSSG